MVSQLQWPIASSFSSFWSAHYFCWLPVVVPLSFFHLTVQLFQFDMAICYSLHTPTKLKCIRISTLRRGILYSLKRQLSLGTFPLPQPTHSICHPSNIAPIFLFIHLRARLYFPQASLTHSDVDVILNFYYFLAIALNDTVLFFDFSPNWVTSTCPACFTSIFSSMSSCIPLIVCCISVVVVASTSFLSSCCYSGCQSLKVPALTYNFNVWGCESCTSHRTNFSFITR